MVAVNEVTCSACGGDRHTLVARTVDFCYGSCANEFDYVRCTHCRQVYLRNRPLVSELSVIYPAEYLSNDYRQHLGGAIARLRDAFQRTKIDVLRRYLRAGDLVAEIGPGGGDYLDIVHRHGDPSWDVLGIDFSETAVAAMRKRGLRAIQSRIEDIAWEERPAGAFVMHQLIEHVEDPRLVLRKCSQALREGGVMVLETPSTQAWDARIFPARYWAGWHAPRHWSLFDENTLSRLARQEGFEVAEINYILSPFVVLHSLQYLLRERMGLGRIARIFDVDRILPLFAASALDRLLLALGFKTSNMQMVLRKPMVTAVAAGPTGSSRTP